VKYFRKAFSFPALQQGFAKVNSHKGCYACAIFLLVPRNQNFCRTKVQSPPDPGCKVFVRFLLLLILQSASCIAVFMAKNLEKIFGLKSGAQRRAFDIYNQL
jgi:hypothetical protein